MVHRHMKNIFALIRERHDFPLLAFVASALTFASVVGLIMTLALG